METVQSAKSVKVKKNGYYYYKYAFEHEPGDTTLPAEGMHTFRRDDDARIGEFFLNNIHFSPCRPFYRARLECWVSRNCGMYTTCT